MASDDDNGAVGEAAVETTGGAPPEDSIEPAAEGGVAQENGGSSTGPTTGSFAVELSGAMHVVAEGWHERLKEEADRDWRAHLGRVEERAASEEAELRASVDDDLARVEQWARQATRQIEEDRARQIDDLRTVLEARLELHRSVIAREIEAGEGANAAYLTYLDAFFERLSAEPDPSVIVRLAGSVPPKPDVEAAGAAARAEAEAELAQETRTPGETGEPGTEPELVPVMDPAAVSGAQPAEELRSAVEGPAAGGDEVEAVPATDSESETPEGAVVAASSATGPARSGGPWPRLAGLLGRGGEAGPERSEGD